MDTSVSSTLFLMFTFDFMKKSTKADMQPFGNHSHTPSASPLHLFETSSSRKRKAINPLPPLPENRRGEFGSFVERRTLFYLFICYAVVFL